MGIIVYDDPLITYAMAVVAYDGGLFPDEMTTHDIFYGFAEAWPATWQGAQVQGDHTVQLRAVDAFKILALAKMDIDRPQEPTGTRISAVLDAISWPGTMRDIDTGQSEVQAVTLTGTSVLAHIQEVAASEVGVFFIGKDGVATFQDRGHNSLLDEDNDVWGDAATEKHYAYVNTSYDDDTLWNDVTVTAPDLTAQHAEDVSSQAIYSGPATAPRTLEVSTLLTSEAEMLDRAEFLIGKYSEPHFRITGMAVENASLDDTQWPRLLLHDVHERVLVRKRPGGGDVIEQPSFIEGIDWDIQSRRWVVTWRLSSTALQVGTWELGTAGKSELGVTTTLVSI